jgi:hypothetical protein
MGYEYAKTHKTQRLEREYRIYRILNTPATLVQWQILQLSLISTKPLHIKSAQQICLTSLPSGTRPIDIIARPLVRIA